MKSPAFKSDAKEESEGPATTPLGVQTLSFLCGILVAILGFKSAWQDFREIHKQTHMDAFIETPGKLLKVGVRRDSAGTGDYYPDVLYEYFVEGKSVWGWRLSYEDEPRPEAFWKDRLARYAEGRPVPVFYNPHKHKDSILEKKHDGLYRTGMKMALGVLFLLAGLLLAYLPASIWIRTGLGK